MPELNRAWYAVHTNAKAEPSVTAAIEAMGIGVLYPLCSWWVKHNHRREMRMGPLFPRYLFAEFDVQSEFWQRITREPGVVGLLGMTEGRRVPQPINQKKMADLIEICRIHAGAIPLVDENEKTEISKGDRVVVAEGPFQAYRGLVKKAAGDRLGVMFDMMNLKKPIMLRREALVRE